jgi:hypothetical protein
MPVRPGSPHSGRAAQRRVVSRTERNRYRTASTPRERESAARALHSIQELPAIGLSLFSKPRGQSEAY